MRPYYLIYDDQCPLCLAALDKLTAWDKLGLVTPVPLSHPTLPDSLPLPPADQLRQALHLIDSEGNLYLGAEAVARIATLFPRSRLLGRVLLWPGIRTLARIVYSYIACHRVQLARLPRRSGQS